MAANSPKIAYITAGAAGMYCGSCLHDNALAAALGRLGADVQLIPTYTPIRTDEQDVSVDRVFFGGINVYLQQTIPLFRHLPAFIDRFFDQPWLIRRATSSAAKIDARQLGSLTVSMLRGTAGNQRKEVSKLVTWLCSGGSPRAGAHLANTKDATPIATSPDSARSDVARSDVTAPDIVNFSNILIAGCAPALKAALNVPLLVTLQGDDIFLNDLPEPYRSQAFNEIQKILPFIDGFIVFSRFYGAYMEEYFKIPREKINVVPLGIDLRDFFSPVTKTERPHASRPSTIGYLARLAPAKGLHILIDSFIRLRQRAEHSDTRLHIAGWLGSGEREYAEAEFAKLRAAGLGDAFHYAGSVNRQEKIEFLRGLDILSVPTTYRDPKGLFVLEALAAGVPVVQPEHGAFPELLAATGGGRLARPNDAEHLAEVIGELLTHPEERQALGKQGREAVHGKFHADAMARSTMDVYQRYLKAPKTGLTS